MDMDLRKHDDYVYIDAEGDRLGFSRWGDGKPILSVTGVGNWRRDTSFAVMLTPDACYQLAMQLLIAGQERLPAEPVIPSDVYTTP